MPCVGSLVWCAAPPLREAHPVWLSNARSELIGTRLRTTEASNRCSHTRTKGQVIEPDTMGMVSTDDDDGIRWRRPPWRLWAGGARVGGTSP